MTGSPLSRRAALRSAGALLATAATPAPLAFAQATKEKPSVAAVDGAIRALLSGNPAAFFTATPIIDAYPDIDIAPLLIFALRFTRFPRSNLEVALRRVTGETDRQGWFDWMLWQEANPQITPHPAYLAIKRDIFLSIDQNFDVFLREEFLAPDATRIRFEEITWGGVRKDGIPSLDDPAMIPAGEAAYLRDDDLVFGVSINGDARAYPLRIMGWHEMFNATIGGVPLALAYCTLCGSGILFETDVAGRSAPFVFGSSGFLYRSNKLMFDRETHSLWNQFTGEPVMGPLAKSGLVLKQRPVVITPWGDWRRQNPETTVLALETGHDRDYGSGVVYKDYFASDTLMFPTIVDQSRLQQKDYVFGVRTAGAAKAWPLPAFEGGRVLNDAVGALPVVLIGDAARRTVRAYDRGALRFDATDDPATLSAEGAAWTVSEDALIGPNGERAPRVAGHIAYWFAWNGYLGVDATLYEDS